MKRKVLVVIVLLTILVPVILLSASSILEFRRSSEPNLVVRVPNSWGDPISISHKPRIVIILFSGGHIIMVRIPFSNTSGYYIKIERVMGLW